MLHMYVHLPWTKSLKGLRLSFLFEVGYINPLLAYSTFNDKNNIRPIIIIYHSLAFVIDSLEEGIDLCLVNTKRHTKQDYTRKT